MKKLLILCVLSMISLHAIADTQVLQDKKKCPRVCLPWEIDPCCIHPPVSG